jgi:hypothetical protein
VNWGGPQVPSSGGALPCLTQVYHLSPNVVCARKHPLSSNQTARENMNLEGRVDIVLCRLRF